ncbi:MAG: hypothetical protein AAGI15_00130 [Pseudomonadota bacterium]
MTASEGTIHFAYDLKAPASAGAPPADDEAAPDPGLPPQLLAWQELLQRLTLLDRGRDGNGISYRERPNHATFALTPPGGQPKPGNAPANIDAPIRILGCNLQRFWIDAEGVCAPGPESLLHGAIYAADPRVQWVIQARCPPLWRHAEALGLPSTEAGISAHSAELIQALGLLVSTHQSRPLVLAVPGDADCVFACGPTARDTAGLLISYLARALTFEPQP